MKLSLLSIDLGFDVRLTGELVYLPLSLRGVHTVLHHRKGTTLGKMESTGTLTSVVEALASEGYSVVACKTKNGREVQCIPTELCPDGDGFKGSIYTWTVQHCLDNYWRLGTSMQSALDRAGWSESDLR